MNETLALLRESFVQDALKAALMVAVACSFLGVFVVLKRIVFVGAALAEVSSLGAALAFAPPVIWLFDRVARLSPALREIEHYRPILLALLLMLVAVAFFARQSLSRRLPREAIIGAVYAGAIGLTLLALSAVPAQGEHAMDILNGNILGVRREEINELIAALFGVGVIQALFHKEFVLVSFDPEVARTLGFRAARWELLWYLMLGAMIAVSIHVAGTVLVFAYLVIPPVCALMLFRRLGPVLLCSVAVGTLATIAGVLISISPADLPTSPAIVGCLAHLAALFALVRAALGLFAGRGPGVVEE